MLNIICLTVKFTWISFCFKMTLQFLSTECSTRETHILEGNSLIIMLAQRPLVDDDRFSVNRNNKPVVRRRNRNQPGPGIVKGNSLELQDLKVNESGTYSIEVFDGKGKQVTAESLEVRVHGKTFGIINAILLQIFFAFNGCEKKKWHLLTLMTNLDILHHISSAILFNFNKMLNIYYWKYINMKWFIILNSAWIYSWCCPSIIYQPKSQSQEWILHVKIRWFT